MRDRGPTVCVRDSATEKRREWGARDLKLEGAEVCERPRPSCPCLGV